MQNGIKNMYSKNAPKEAQTENSNCIWMWVMHTDSNEEYKGNKNNMFITLCTAKQPDGTLLMLASDTRIKFYTIYSPICLKIAKHIIEESKAGKTILEICNQHFMRMQIEKRVLSGKIDSISGVV